MSQSISYRPEIDGLRAVAIVAVVLFHLDVPWMIGGFVGVDVFFVISGFLITSLIQKDIAEGSFRLWDFWVRRARRLLPALGSMLVLTSVFGFLILPEAEYRFLGVQVVASLTFWANICMYRNAFDYWGPSAEEFALLHTWSLSVEEQFYLLFPLFLLMVARWGQRRIRWIILASLVGGLMLCCWGAQRHPAATFFVLPTRAWELLIGCALALAMAGAKPSGTSVPSWLRGVFADSGMALVIASTVFVRNDGLFPAPMGLLPTLGAALFIRFGQEHGLSRRLLALGPVVYLGKLSYSWYLFHWPVIVLFRKLGIDGVFPALGTGLGLAILCHHGIEQPLRRIREEWVLTRVVVPVMLIGVSTYLMSRSDFRPRIELAPPVVWCGLDLVPSRTQEKPNPHCITPDLTLYPDRTVRRSAAVHGPVRVVILGDSHLKSALPALDRILIERGWNYAAFPAAGACPFFIPSGANPLDFADSTLWKPDERLALDEARLKVLATNQPTLMVVTARWVRWHGMGRRGIHAGLSRIQELAPNARMLVLGQPPELPFGSGGFLERPPRLGLWTQSRELKAARVQRHQVHDWLREYATLHPGVHFVETESVFLKDGDVQYTDQGKLLYLDDDHLSVDGSLRLVPILTEAIQKIDEAPNRVSH